MNPKLSIIIPCYNCADTLQEAVLSCYQQNLSTDEFEIIMVDDGSTDTTVTVMETIANEYPNITLLYHEKNRGGGAARNTGIKAAKGEIIYCLDSDNFFAPNSVQPMLIYLEENNLDGVAFYERRFFVGTNSSKFTVHHNQIFKTGIDLSDLFNESGTLLDNFFYTKTAYLKTAGYPEHHGFDTQCYEVRFIAAGNTVTVCPGSIFYHRQAKGEKSYFERVYESGEYSLNMYYILEDIIHLLSTEAITFILMFDCFNQTKLGTGNLLGALVNHFKNRTSDMFITDYTSGYGDTIDSYLTKPNTHDIVRAVYHYRKTEYAEAIRYFSACLKSDNPSTLLYYNIFRCSIGQSGIEKSQIEKVTKSVSQSFILKKQTIDLNPSIFKRLLLGIYLRLKT